MCVAELNVSNLPCRHRWYHLVRSCSEGFNLENCSKKLGLEGWEIRCDFCPYCDAWEIDNASYRLFGGERHSSIGTHSLTRRPSTSLSSTRRESRRGSLSRTDSNTSLTMMTHSVKNRATNARLDNYLTSRPERMLSVDSRPSELTDDDEGSPTESGSSSNGSNPTATHAKPSVFGKSLKKSKKMKKFFSFVK